MVAWSAGLLGLTAICLVVVCQGLGSRQRWLYAGELDPSAPPSRAPQDTAARHPVQ